MENMELTKDNYLYGTGHGETWHVNINPPKNKVRTYYEETVTAVEYVYANKSGKIQVLYSGGQDSQYVCEVLLKLGIEFEPVIIQLKGNNIVYNDFDIKYAFEFCEAKNLKPTIYDLDFEYFVKSGKLVEVAESVTCSAFEVATSMYVASQLDGFTILGNDPPYMRLEPNNIWVLEEKEFIHSLLRFYKKFNLNGCPYLLSYTPEMMLAFLLDPTIVKLGNNLIPGKTGTNSSKAHVFNNGSGFNIEPYDFVSKKRIKQTGYEKVYQSELINHPNLQIFADYKKIWNGEYLEPYNKVVERLSVFQ